MKQSVLSGNISLEGGYMHATQNSKQKVSHRLKIAKGHLEKVIAMIEDDSYCMDIIHQSQAIQSALKKVDIILLENHLKNCVVNNIKEGKVEPSINEILKVFEKKE